MKKKAKKESGATTCSMVRKEMAKPRMAKSAREGINPGAGFVLALRERRVATP
jgi:hypothetical protein